MNLTKKIKLLYRYGQCVIGLKKNDIILTSYPRSGNTWVRFFLCHLISLNEWQGKRVDFNILDQTMPELGVNNLIKVWDHPTLPRIIKTHKPYWPLFRKNRSILLLRDPCNVMASYYNFEMSRRNKRFIGSFSEFIRTDKFGLKAWAEHYNSWKERAGLTLFYEDFKKDDRLEFQKIVDFLKLNIEGNIFEEAVKKSRLKNIQKLEARYGLSKQQDFLDGFEFAGKREGEKGKNEFNHSDLKYFQYIMKKYDIIYPKKNT